MALIAFPNPPAATGAKVQQPGRARPPWAGFIALMRWKSFKKKKQKGVSRHGWGLSRVTNAGLQQPNLGNLIVQKGNQMLGGE